MGLVCYQTDNTVHPNTLCVSDRRRCVLTRVPSTAWIHLFLADPGLEPGTLQLWPTELIGRMTVSLRSRRSRMRKLHGQATMIPCRLGPVSRLQTARKRSIIRPDLVLTSGTGGTGRTRTDTALETRGTD